MGVGPYSLIMIGIVPLAHTDTDTDTDTHTQGMPCTQCEILNVGQYSDPTFDPF